MSHVIIDRRKNDKAKSTVNRSRYMRRVKESVKEAVRELIRDGSISDTLAPGSKDIKIKKKNLDQPDFHLKGIGGQREYVYPGNKEFVVGDKIKRPDGGITGDGDEDAGDGESQDEFTFTISQKEFLDIFFEDLYLPNLVKKDMVSVVEYAMKRAGFSVDGNPARLNIIRSMKQSMARTMALVSKEEEELEKLEDQLIVVILELGVATMTPGAMTIHLENEQYRIEKRIKELKAMIKAVPFLDDMDLRYNRWDKFPIPTTQAVMFGIMDVSGSMGEWEKDMAKRFFILMVLFLRRKYEKVEIVWIRHTTEAKEVSEDEFFHSQESGGTIISTSYELMHQIQEQRYPKNNWNVFGVQISDGDNMHSDHNACLNYMKNVILPVSQYFAYVETRKRDKTSIASLFGAITGTYPSSDMYTLYGKELIEFENFVETVITDASEIYPVFRKLFEKENA